MDITRHPVLYDHQGPVTIFPSEAVAQRLLAVMAIAKLKDNDHRTEGLVLEQIMCAACGEGSQLETDNYGQVVVYTNLKEDGREQGGSPWPNKLVAMTDDEFDTDDNDEAGR